MSANRSTPAHAMPAKCRARFAGAWTSNQLLRASDRSIACNWQDERSYTSQPSIYVGFAQLHPASPPVHSILPAPSSCRHYGGYITVDEEAGRHLYYYMAMSEGDPAGDPVMLWMNGGPVSRGVRWGVRQGGGDGGFIQQIGQVFNSCG